jgi:hypothetical protein
MTGLNDFSGVSTGHPFRAQEFHLCAAWDGRRDIVGETANGRNPATRRKFSRRGSTRAINKQTARTKNFIGGRRTDAGAIRAWQRRAANCNPRPRAAMRRDETSARRCRAP